MFFSAGEYLNVISMDAVRTTKISWCLREFKISLEIK